jgi:hypothetical protein
MKRFERLLAVIGAAALFVAGSAVATEASNGSTIKFGRTTKGTKTTTLQVTSGTAAPLKLLGKSTSAPLVTNMTGQVANLNASMVGGASLASTTYVASDDTTSSVTYDLSLPAVGTYLVTLAAEVSLRNGATQFYCYMYPKLAGSPDLLSAIGTVYNLGSDVAISASRVVTVAEKDLVLRCTTPTGDGWNTTTEAYYYGPTLTFTPLPAPTSGALVARPVVPLAPGAAPSVR